MAVAVALIRGVTRKEGKGIGNFWADLVRGNLYVLLPICVVYALFLISQGMIQNFHPYIEATTLEGVKQIIAQGPVASQVAIKMLGTNGGGFFNANAAHPFENPTPLSNFVQMLSIFLIPSALVYMLGRMAKRTKHGWSVWVAMRLLFLAGVFVAAHFEDEAILRWHSRGCFKREHGRKGSAIRSFRFGAVRHDHDRCFLRRCQRHARQFHSHGRLGALRQHSAR